MTKTTSPPDVDPDEQMTGPMIARELGITPATWRSYRARHDAGVPEPDGREPLTDTPYWYRRTFTAWRDQRQGRGWRKGVPGAHADRKAAAA